MNSNSNAPFGQEDFFIKAYFGSEGPAGAAGKDGQTPTISVGKVQTVQAGQSAQVVNSGTAKDAVFDFKIPQGPAGQNTSLREPHYDSYEELCAEHPQGGTEGEAYLVGEVNFIYVWDLNTNSWVSVGKLGYLPKTFTDFKETVEQELAARYTKVETDGQISAHNADGAAHNDIRQAIADNIASHNTNTAAHADIRQAIEALQLLKLVDVLPAQGESKYIYAVPQDERTTDGQLIVVLFIWTGTEWAAVGALTTSVDLTDYLKKTEADSTYFPKYGGTLTGSLTLSSFINFTADRAGKSQIILPGSGQISGFDTGNIFIQNSNNGLIFRKSDNQLVRRRNNVDSILLTEADKGVSGGVASLGSDGKVPQEQLPNISAATPAVDLGQVTSASFEVNKNYAVSVSGSASFTLPTPADTTIANKITLNLNVLANSVIDWGTNINAALAEFTPGKYQIRLLWNNTSSAWSAEVLKETEASSPVKLLIHFNGSISDESASPLTLTPSRTVTAFPVYAEGQYGQQKLTCTGDSEDNYVTASGNNLPKLNLGTGDFTIKCWLTLAARYSSPVRIFYKDDNNQIALGNDRIQIRIGGDLLLNQGFSGVEAGDTAYITLTRQNGVLYFFANGTLVTSQASAEAWNLSDWTQIFKGSIVGGVGHYGIQELIVKNTCDYVANFTVPSAPFVLSDNCVSDLHDIKMAELYSSISALQNELQILKGQSMKRLDYTNAVEFYLKEEGQTSYTVPANGYIFGYGFQTYKTVGNSYTGNILINGINVGKYFRKYTLNNDQVDTSIPLSMPLPVSAGDVITITGNREAFQEPYLFVPEKED